MNGLKKDSWVSFLNSISEEEAGLLFDALDGIYQEVVNRPAACQKKFVSKTQLIILVLLILALDNLALPLIVKALGIVKVLGI